MKHLALLLIVLIASCTVNRYIVIVQPKHECPVPKNIYGWESIDPEFYQPIIHPFDYEMDDGFFTLDLSDGAIIDTSILGDEWILIYDTSKAITNYKIPR